MSKIRINDLARELEVKSKAILDVLSEVGVTEKKTHSSSLEDFEAEKVRAHFHASQPASAAAQRQSRSEPGEIKTKIDLSHISKPGDVLKAIIGKQQPAPPVAPPARPVAPPPVQEAKPAAPPIAKPTVPLSPAPGTSLPRPAIPATPPRPASPTTVVSPPSVPPTTPASPRIVAPPPVTNAPSAPAPLNASATPANPAGQVVRPAAPNAPPARPQTPGPR